MGFKTLEQWPASGTVSLQGYIAAEYDKLVEKLGEPTDGDGEKVDAEWLIQFDDKTFATIYNYKDGVNYLGTSGLRVSEITDWHIGGSNKTAADRVHELFA